MSSHDLAGPDTPAEVPWTLPNGVKATYDLHCHCGAIKYQMTLSPPLYAEETEGGQQCVPVECNCSWCERNGLITVHPLASNVEFTHGLEHRVEYLCGSRQNPHWFCGRCASVLGTDLRWMSKVTGMEPTFAINVRMLKDFDLQRLRTRPLKFMKTYGPKYEV